MFKMHFQVIKDYFYNQIYEEVHKSFPSFFSVFDKEDGAYPLLGELGCFILKHSDKKDIIEQTIDFINKALQKGEYETEDAIIIEMFSKLYEDSILADNIERGLYGKALILFRKYRKKSYEDH